MYSGIIQTVITKRLPELDYRKPSDRITGEESATLAFDSNKEIEFDRLLDLI